MDINSYKQEITNFFFDCEDFFCREGGNENSRFAVMFIKGITSRDFIAESILRPLIKSNLSDFNGDFSILLESPSLTPALDSKKAAENIAKGEVLVLIESNNGFFKTHANAEFTVGRSIEEPSSDVTIRGPKSGFVEDAEKNTSMLRKYIRTPDLKFKSFTVGSVSSTKVLIAYVSGRADEKLVRDVSDKISRIKADVITDSANISMLLTGRKNPPFPDCGSTEKVDKVASKLMAGRIAVIVDGSPFVLTIPFLFIEGLQASDDYLHTPYYATFIRILRSFALLSAIFAPAILCTVINYNPEIMPPQFYGIIQDARKDIPLSFFWEIVAILLLFELLREVGVRMPRTVGDAVGIVGSIILGNTAVEAGIVSSVGVITVAFSAVCAFITPAYMYVIVLARIFVLAMCELLGIAGLCLSAAVLIIMLITKKSFGVHYLSPMIPFDRKGIQDTIFAWPKKTLGRREELKK